MTNRPSNTGHNGTEHPTPTGPSIFDNLDALRLAPEQLSATGSSEVLTHVPVRKPGRTEFFRVHPDPAMSLMTGIFEDKEEREVYFVTPNMRAALAGEMKPVQLVVAITPQRVVFLWPVSLPDDSGRSNPWWDTARDAAEQAKTCWTRMSADMALRAYRIYRAEGELSEPNWPDKSLSQLMEIAFRDRIIDSPDHPVVRRLRGLT